MPVRKAAGPPTFVRGLGAYDGLLCALQLARRLGRHDEFWAAYRRRRRAGVPVERATAFAAHETMVTPSRPTASDTK